MTENKISIKCSKTKCPEYILIKYKSIIDSIYASIAEYMSSSKAKRDLQKAKDTDEDWISEIAYPDQLDQLISNQRAFHLIMNYLYRKIYIAKRTKIMSMMLNKPKIRVKYYWNYW